MKHNLLHYLRDYRDKSFREHPFSEVDALVLAQLSYLKYDGIVPGFGGQPAMGLEEIRRHSKFEGLFDDQIYGKSYRKIFMLLYGSRRYGKIRLNYYINDFDPKKEIQFSAVTIFLGETSVYISYRGTDESLIGWKEDFNMAFMQSIPGQRRAAAYLLKAAKCTEGRIVLGGHSKGGNLAVYAGSFAPRVLQKRISRIYSFDGPGFRKEFYERRGFEVIEKRFFKIVPENSYIGILFFNHPTYRVVRSYGQGVIQHDLLRWKIRDGEFVYRKKVYRRSRRWMKKINRWIDALSYDQAAAMVEALYQIFVSADLSSVYELLKKPFQVIRLLIREFSALDQKSRGLVKELFVRVLKSI